MIGLGLGALLHDEEVGASAAPTDLAATILAGPEVQLDWTDTAEGNSAYSIERADLTTGGGYSELVSVAGTAITYTDAGPFDAGHRYNYRLVVVGGENDGEISNVVTALGAGARGVYTALANSSARRMPYRRGR